MRYTGLLIALVMLCLNRALAEPGIAVLRINDREPSSLMRAVKQALPEAQVTSLAMEDFVAGRVPHGVTVLIVPDASQLPAVLGEPLQRWLRSRKAVLFVSDQPPVQSWLHQAKGRWVSRQEALLELSAWRPLWRQMPPESAWRRSTDSPQIASTWAPVDTPHGKGWRLSVARLTNWCTYDTRVADAFREGEALLSFRAKGNASTRAVSIEWREKDGSRWYATVPLSTEWKQFVLLPADFQYWYDNPSKGRGGPGDRLQPQNAVEVSIGLAQSFASFPADTPLEVTIADIRVGRLGQALTEPPELVLEGVAPWHQFYTDSRGRLRSVWRYPGAGIGGECPGRRIAVPLDERASLFVSAKGDTAGSMWAWIPASEARAGNLSALLRPMTRGWHLLRAGTTQFGFWTDQLVEYGAEVANWSAQTVTLQLQAQLSSPNQTARRSETSVRLQPGERRQVLFPNITLPEGEWHVRVVAVSADGKRDELQHRFHVLGKPASVPRISVRNGRFYRGDQPFFAHGINFWPLWIAGQERSVFYEHWLSPWQYDPEAVERALRIAREVGFNVLSVQYMKLAHAPQLVDFMERARRHGMYVNLFITAAHPFGFDPKLLRHLIEAARIPQWDNLFAYDIAWEPAWGTHTERKRFDAAWREWIIEQYGSFADAERDWGFSLPREDGQVTNPTDEQILTDGEWRRMVAAYRRFQDDHVNRAYWRVVRFIRQIDPYHLIGVRTGYGGNGSEWADNRMPYDLLAGAPILDFVSPEAYSLMHSWENFRAGGFITSYARWAGNGKPVFWAEFGATIYPDVTPERIAYQRNVYEWMYRMAEESRADGTAGWWFPGGVRLSENSDYGIIHPDGSLRPAARVAQQWARRLARLPETPDTREVHVITIDRDLHARGFSQVWKRHRQEYLQAVTSGKRVEVRTPGTGVTSEEVPLVAVGNVPWNGQNPSKYLNAQILRVQAVLPSGEVQELEPDETIPLGATSLHVTVLNTGDAAWSPPGKREVHLFGSWGAQAQVRSPVARYGQTTLSLPLPQEVQEPLWLRMRLVTENGSSWGFGEKRVLK